MYILSKLIFRLNGNSERKVFIGNSNKQSDSQITISFITISQSEYKFSQLILSYKQSLHNSILLQTTLKFKQQHFLSQLHNDQQKLSGMKF